MKTFVDLRSIVTDLCVMDFGGPDHAIRVRSLHPGVSFDEVQDATGFPLVAAPDLGTTAPPNAEDLRIVRALDPHNLRATIVQQSGAAPGMRSDMEATQVFGDGVVDYAVEDGIATITMNRPEYHNAQNSKMTYALDAALRAAHDDAVKAIVLAGAGKHFSAGHDIGTPGRDIHESFDRASLWYDHVDKEGGEFLMRASRRCTSGCAGWRDLPKPTIAMQGACIAGGLMLAWCATRSSRPRMRSSPIRSCGWGFRASSISHMHTSSTRASRRSSCSSASGCRPSARTRWGWSTVWCRASGCATRPMRSPRRSRRCRASPR